MKFLHWIQQGALAICLGALIGGSFAESHAAMLNTGTSVYLFRKIPWKEGSWKNVDKSAENLDSTALMDHLNNLASKQNCLRELGRLILAQEIPEHNNSKNRNSDYMDLNSKDLCRSIPMIDLLDHLFNQGHLGYYLQALSTIGASNVRVNKDPSDVVNQRGIFNIARVIRGNIMHNAPLEDLPLYGINGIAKRNGYRIDPVDSSNFVHITTLEEAAINLVTALFSSNDFLNRPGRRDIQIEQGHCGNRNRFTITATYTGGTIEGIDYLNLGADNDCLGVKSSGKSTNEICVVVEVTEGRIRIVSLFPFG